MANWEQKSIHSDRLCTAEDGQGISHGGPGQERWAAVLEQAAENVEVAQAQEAHVKSHQSESLMAHTAQKMFIPIICILPGAWYCDIEKRRCTSTRGSCQEPSE